MRISYMPFESEVSIREAINFKAPDEKKKKNEEWEERNPKKSGPQPGDSGSERNTGNGHAHNRSKDEEHKRIPPEPCPQRGKVNRGISG